jgi:DNA-binding HxlR family transcriptional regulator
MNTKEHILSLIRKSGALGPSDIARQLKISPQMVHRHLKTLVANNELRRLGSPPKVLYQALDKPQQILAGPQLASEDADYINEHYMNIRPNGEKLEGTIAFMQWARQTKQDKHLAKLAHEYVENHKKITQSYKSQLGIIDATFKVKETFEQCCLDHLFYQEFYSLPKFGKTKTGHLIFLGKSGQDIDSIELLAKMCKASIVKLIETYKIDCVIFAPHSIPRKIPFLKVFKQQLRLPTPSSELIKVFSGKTPIAQKSLSKLSDRIENANNTIFTQEDNSKYKRILVIDDAVGSGATLNAIACKLKQNANARFVCGFAVTGSLKGFEVINEI